MKSSLIKIAISVLVFAAALVFVSKLEIKSNMEDMLPEDSPYLVASKDFEQYFDAQEQAVILISNDNRMESEAFDEAATAYMDALADSITKQKIVHNVLYKVDDDALRDYIWAYMEQEDFDDLSDIIKSGNPETIMTALEQFQDRVEEQEGDTYLTSDDGMHYMMILKPVLDNKNFETTRMAFYNGMMDTIDSLNNNEQFRELEVGMTGGAFIQDIEGDTVAFDGMDSTLIVTLLLILVIVALFFGGIKIPLLSIYPLILGAVSAAAAGYLIFGSINMFSVSFAMLLLGLGIDFAVHLIARYKEERSNDKSLEESVQIATKSTGMSIIIGAVTTAFAFATFGLAQFRAFAQMGIISAVGIALLCLAMLILIPALITVFDKRAPKARRLALPFGWMEIMTRVIIKRKWVVAVLIAVLIATLFTSVSETKVIGDLTAIYPDNLPSVEYADKLQEAFDYNSNTVNVYFDDIEDLRAGVEALEAKDSIASVNSVLDYLPDNASERLDTISEIEPMLLAMGIPLFDEMVLETPTYEVLPEVIKQNFVGMEGKLLAEIVPKYDIFKEAACDVLIDDVNSAIGKSPVGLAIVMNEVTELVTEDTLNISIMCLTAVLIIALFAFRHIAYALLTLLPIGLSLYITLGLLPLFDIQVNLFSVASFPLIIGIGVDSSIHLIHRLKEDSDQPIDLLTKMTGQAIILTCLTTMIGFGSLSGINHPGMQNFGLVVVVGMVVNLVMTLTVVPIGSSLIRQLSSKTGEKEEVLESAS